MRLSFVDITEIDPQRVEDLLDRAFGPGRTARTAYRVRAGLSPLAHLSFGAVDEEERLMGSMQCWPVALQVAGGASHPLVMVGPVAVDPGAQGIGIGRAMMHHMLGEAFARGCEPLMMVGDPDYYRPFGFTAQGTAGWALPGPFEPHRLLLRNLDARALPERGMIGPRFA